MKVLITGSTGFIGSHLARKWAETDEVTGFDLVPPTGDIDYRHITGDITDFDRMCYTLQNIRPSVIVNLAAVSNQGCMAREPLHGFRTNVMGPVTLLEAACKVQCKDDSYNPAIILAGSNEEYGHSDEVRSDFEGPLWPASLYAASKAAQYHIAHGYRRSSGIRPFVVRFPNIYGPGQSIRNLIPLAINRLIKGGDLVLQNNGKGLRDWLYVTDACAAVMQIGIRQTYPRYTLSGTEYSTGYIVCMIKQALDDLMIEIKGDVKLDGNDVGQRRIKMAHGGAPYGWKPLVPINNGVMFTVHAATKELARGS